MSKGMNLPRTKSRFVQNTSNGISSGVDQDILHYAQERFRQVQTTKLSRGIMKALIGGATKDEVKTILDAGMFSDQSLPWSRWVAILKVANGDIEMLKYAEAANIDSLELKALMQDKDFSVETLRVMSHLTQRAGKDLMSNREERLDIKSLRKKM